MKQLQWQSSFYTLGNMIDRLKEVIEHPQISEIDYVQDATIHRFKLTIELFWKVLKKILLHEKLEATIPRDTLSKAYQYQLIDSEDIWLNMLDDRNNTSQVYNEEQAKLIFEHIQSYLAVFIKTYTQLKARYQL